MFSAWNFADWVISVGSAALAFLMVAAIAALGSYTATRIWGDEPQVSEPPGGAVGSMPTESAIRKAA